MTTHKAVDPLQATDPAANASVHASAGTGKTWLLTTRIIRLLMAGARPDAFLPDLAASLNNLGNQLAALGRRDDLALFPDPQADA